MKSITYFNRPVINVSAYYIFSACLLYTCFLHSSLWHRGCIGLHRRVASRRIEASRHRGIEASRRARCERTMSSPMLASSIEQASSHSIETASRQHRVFSIEHRGRGSAVGAAAQINRTNCDLRVYFACTLVKQVTETSAFRLLSVCLSHTSHTHTSYTTIKVPCIYTRSNSFTV